MNDNTNQNSTEKNSFQEPELAVEDLTNALYQVNLKLDQTIRERNEIFNNISHDLRAPITAIRNAVEYLESLDHISEADINETLPLISKRTLLLEKMINDIFLLTKLDSQPALMHPEPICAGVFLEDFYYNNCFSDSKFQDRVLTLNVPESFEYPVMIDPFYMTRVLDNLVNNALKYTSGNDSIVLSASYQPADIHLCCPAVQIIISDTGVGISRENLPHIFERTFMSSSARTPSAHSGAGLGLAICSKIIDLFHGTIWCESTENAGSSFFIVLPLKK